jgi:polygalacturonase
MLQRFSGLSIFNSSLFLLSLAVLPVHGQDSRTVTEPVIPTVCSVHTATIASTNGDLSSANNAHFDTSRIQAALNICPSGQAVELQAANGDDAFQIQPITIPAGVTLLIDPGVTVFASINPRDYDIASGSCGIVAASSAGCKPVIGVSGAANAAVMGGGVINGRGGDTLTGLSSSWWQLSAQAKTLSLNQFNPRLIQVSGSNNFTLYQITLVNAPLFHVTYGGGSGFTAWGVTINTPGTSRNTDGIDPGNGSNFTITESSITDGDDNVAIGASNTATSHATISNNYFGSGHGVSIVIAHGNPLGRYHGRRRVRRRSGSAYLTWEKVHQSKVYGGLLRAVGVILVRCCRLRAIQTEGVCGIGSITCGVQEIRIGCQQGTLQTID